MYVDQVHSGFQYCFILKNIPWNFVPKFHLNNPYKFLYDSHQPGSVELEIKKNNNKKVCCWPDGMYSLIFVSLLKFQTLQGLMTL